MKTATTGDVAIVNGELAIVLWTAQGKNVTFEFFNKFEECPHCKKQIRKQTITMLESCPNFQKGVEPAPTIKTR